MKYDPTRSCISVSSDELISLALEHSTKTREDDCSVYHADKALCAIHASSEPTELLYTEQMQEYTLEINSHADAFEQSGENATLTFVFLCDTDVQNLPQRVTKYVRARAFCAAYIYRSVTQAKKITLRIICCSSESEKTKTLEETPTNAALDKFFARLLASFELNAQNEIERVVKRLPTMKALRFPYRELRAGQNDFMSSAYSAIKHCRTLTACAPTGTGKTVCSLYPAVRAMGEGECEKIFYLTPKGTTALAAAETVKRMCEQGAKINSVILSSKEKICQNRSICREGVSCERGCFSSEKMAQAMQKLCSLGISPVERKHITPIATEYNVCPYELSLNYSMICDIIICDYNYLFDPKAYLRRYFDRTGDYCFLIDESHNLPDRVRDMYSLEISLSKLKEYSHALARIETIKGILTDACRTFASVLYPLCKSETRITPSGERVACVSSASLPSSLHVFFATLKQKCERFYFARRADLTREEYKVIRELLSTLRSALDACAVYGSGHRTIVQRKDSELCVKILCIDPSGIITKRLDCGKSAVMFSATLLPTEYYHTLLTGGRNALSVDIPSPFDKDNLCIAVLDSISTRYSDREQNAHAICNAIFTTVSAKKGNYMVFCPSFSYMEYIHSVFCSSHPSVSSIIQKRSMSMRERSEFLTAFQSSPDKTLVAFCVMGGIYSEGIDLAGDRLIGAVIIGAGLPTPTIEREAMSEYYAELYESGREYAYIYPGMNRVMQAAGRVIRRDDDQGVLLLIDDRFKEGVYRKIIPEHWKNLKYTADTRSLGALLEKFWGKM